MNHLRGRRIQISGSANPSTQIERIRYAHDLVHRIANGILAAGGGLVVGVGKEPRVGDDPDAPALHFDWTVLEAVAEYLRAGSFAFPEAAGLPVVVVTSEKNEDSIPDERRSLWEELLDSEQVAVERIRAGSRAAALIQLRQADFSEVLLIIGGGAGVEHLAELFLDRNRTVLPLDLEIGASRGDGTGGGARLSKEARADPTKFLRLDPSISQHAGTRLAMLATRQGGSAAEVIAPRVVSLLCAIDRPKAFYVRLLNPAHPRHAAVEGYFRGVVDPVVQEAGYRRVEVGTDRAEHGFINLEIFRNLHHAAVVIVDVTGLRPNCFIELGYALGRGLRVLVTAESGTELPFDQQAIPCCFWSTSESNAERQSNLVDFWQKYIDRAALIR